MWAGTARTVRARSTNQGKSEPLRPDESHDKVSRKRGGDGQADESFKHRTLLEPAQRARVKRKHDKAADAGGKKKNIGHMHSPDLSEIRMMHPCRVNYRLGWFGGRIRKR